MHLLGLERAHRHVIKQTSSKSWGHFLHFITSLLVGAQINKLNFASSGLEGPQTRFQLVFQIWNNTKILIHTAGFKLKNVKTFSLTSTRTRRR